VHLHGYQHFQYQCLLRVFLSQLILVSHKTINSLTTLFWFGLEQKLQLPRICMVGILEDLWDN
jgi:hypothetical protein